MKLLVCCLVAIVCCVALCAEGDDQAQQVINKRREVFSRIMKFNRTLKRSNWILHTPPSMEVDNCCSLSALRCFKEELLKLSPPSKNQMLLLRNLQDPLTEKGVNFCSPEQIKDTVCASCHSYPKTGTKEFLQQLTFLFQKANSQ